MLTSILKFKNMYDSCLTVHLKSSRNVREQSRRHFSRAATFCSIADVYTPRVGITKLFERRARILLTTHSLTRDVELRSYVWESSSNYGTIFSLNESLKVGDTQLVGRISIGRNRFIAKFYIPRITWQRIVLSIHRVSRVNELNDAFSRGYGDAKLANQVKGRRRVASRLLDASSFQLLA